MTSLLKIRYKKKKKKRFSSLLASLLFTSLIFFIAVFLSDELSLFALEGIRLSCQVIIPSVFPFLILTDFVFLFINFHEVPFVRKAFEKAFKISGCGISAFICGMLCGFPLGAKAAISLYNNGVISKDECERLMAFSNNASPGYIISAIGVALRGSVKEGIILYISTVISALFSGILSGLKCQKSDFVNFKTEQSYNFLDSIKSAVTVSLNICGFITFFSIISGLLEKYIANQKLKYFLLSVIEIGNGCNALSSASILSDGLSLYLTAFSLGFSGLCVFAQTKSLIALDTPLSFRKYFLIKILQGVLAFLFCYLITVICNLF